MDSQEVAKAGGMLSHIGEYTWESLKIQLLRKFAAK